MRGCLKRLLMMPLLGVLAACQPRLEAVSEPLTATVLFQGQQCGRQAAAPALSRIADAQALAALARRVGRPFSLSEEPDFERRIVLLVEMGMRPTTGYGLALAGPVVAVKRSSAELTLAWRRPAPDAMLAQMVTSPCLLLSLPPAGYDRVEVFDDSGERRLVLDLNLRR